MFNPVTFLACKKHMMCRSETLEVRALGRMPGSERRQSGNSCRLCEVASDFLSVAILGGIVSPGICDMISPAPGGGKLKACGARGAE
jgi:hypothetical protein